MYAKTFTLAFVVLAVVAACLAGPVAEPEPCGGCGDPCTIERCHTVPYSACIPIHTTHRIIPSSNCGYGGWGGLGGWGGHGGWGGLGGWGNAGWGNAGWGNAGCGNAGWGNAGWGNAGWGNAGWGGCGCGLW